MPWDIRKDLHIDIRAPYGRVLLTSGTESSLLQPPPDFVAGDRIPVRLHFWERGSNGSLTAADPGSDTSIIFCGRPNNIPTGSNLLFLTNDFAEIEEGVWEGNLNLSTEEMATHLAESPAGPKAIVGEIEVRDSTGLVKRLSLQFPLTARPQAYENQDSPTNLPEPEEWLDARAVRTDKTLASTNEQKRKHHENLGYPVYANLAAANAALGIGKIYYDLTTNLPEITTA